MGFDRQNKVRALLITVVMAVASTAVGDELSLEQIERQEQELSFKWAKLEKLNLVAGRYKEAYHQFYDGDGSFVDRYEEFNSRSLAWLNQWEKIFSAYQLKNQLDTSNLSRLASTLKRFLDEQRREFIKLEHDARGLEQSSERLGDAINRVATLYPSNYDSSFEPYIKQINQDMAALKKANEALAPVVADRLAELENFTSLAEKKFVTTLRQVLLAEATVPLEQAIDTIEGIFAVDRLATPYYEAARVHFEKIKDYEFNFLQFHAQAELAKLEGTIDQFRRVARSSDLPQFYVDDYMDSMERYYRDAQEKVNLLQEYPAYENLAFAIEELKSKYVKEIRQNNLRCNQRLLNTLSKLGEDELKQLSDYELKKIEFLWDEVGPLTL